MEDLTIVELGRLQDLETIIEKGLQTFVDVGGALLEVRDSRLYKATHGTFEEYCRKRWGMSKTHANRMIEAVRVADNLTPTGVIPATERVARPLVSLSPEEQREAWQLAKGTADSESRPVTARDVADAVYKLKPHKERLIDEDSEDDGADLPLCAHCLLIDDYWVCPLIGRMWREEALWCDGCEFYTVAGDVEGETKTPHVALNSGENEWYTPPEYIEAARKVMECIDLDPASSVKANETVQATAFHTKDESGLDMPWGGKVWMNPPYASELIKKFAAKFAEHVKSGAITEGIVLVNNATETLWFKELIDCASAVVFTTGRIKFLDPVGNPGAPLQGQACIYFGDQQLKFMDAFRPFGWGAML